MAKCAICEKGAHFGILSVKETVINHSDGSMKITKTTKVTGKGQQYFINKFLQSTRV